MSEASDTFIKCTSSHLTSFAVLVAPGGEVRCCCYIIYMYKFIYVTID